jgi:hypothetical protein
LQLVCEGEPCHGGFIKVGVTPGYVALNVGSTVMPHSPNRVVVLLTDQDLKITFPNGETREEHYKAGETMWLSPQRHAGENLSDKPIEFIAVIPKQK